MSGGCHFNPLFDYAPGLALLYLPRVLSLTSCSFPVTRRVDLHLTRVSPVNISFAPARRRRRRRSDGMVMRFLLGEENASHVVRDIDTKRERIMEIQAGKTFYVK